MSSLITQWVRVHIDRVKLTSRGKPHRSLDDAFIGTIVLGIQGCVEDYQVLRDGTAVALDIPMPKLPARGGNGQRVTLAPACLDDSAHVLRVQDDVH